MSDVPTSADPGRATRDVDLPIGSDDAGYGRTGDPALRTQTYRESTGVSDPSAGDQARQVAHEGRQAAAQATGEVTDTAREQAQRVAAEARTQARNLASDARDRIGEQARTQTGRLVTTIRQTADQLEEMRGDRADSPAATVVSRVADGGRQLADYLDRHGPEGVLREVQDFARRRPGAFLATALAAGFVVGRLGKSIAKADSAGYGKPDSDTFTSRPESGRVGYTPTPAVATEYTSPPGGATEYTSTPSGATEYTSTPSGATEYTSPPGGATEYASTGTGTPVPVTEEHVSDNPPPAADYPGGLR